MAILVHKPNPATPEVRARKLHKLNLSVKKPLPSVCVLLSEICPNHRSGVATNVGGLDLVAHHPVLYIAKRNYDFTPLRQHENLCQFFSLLVSFTKFSRASFCSGVPKVFIVCFSFMRQNFVQCTYLQLVCLCFE